MSQVSIDEDKGQLAKSPNILGMLRRVTSPVEIVSPLIHAKIHYYGGDKRPQYTLYLEYVSSSKKWRLHHWFDISNVDHNNVIQTNVSHYQRLSWPK